MVVKLGKSTENSEKYSKIVGKILLKSGKILKIGKILGKLGKILKIRKNTPKSEKKYWKVGKILWKVGKILWKSWKIREIWKNTPEKY